MNRRPPPAGSQLERGLSDLARWIEVPPTPDLAGAVRGRIESRPRPYRRAPVGRLALAAAAVLVTAVAGVTLLSSTAREAVAGWLGIRGIDIVDEAPAPEVDAGLKLGRRTTLEDAQERVPFEILLPSTEGLGPPDDVYLVRTPLGGHAVSLLYRAGEGLPRAAGTGVGLLVTQFEAGLRQDLMQKVKAGGVEVEPVSIGSSQAYWISGDPHFVFFLDPSGGVIEDRTRLAGDTLLWERGEVSLRLESGLDKAQALEIARTMRAP